MMDELREEIGVQRNLMDRLVKSLLKWFGINKVGLVGEYRELAEDMGKCRSIVVEAGQKLGTIGPHPLQREAKEKSLICKGVG